MDRKPISLMRATPPHTPASSEVLQKALAICAQYLHLAGPPCQWRICETDEDRFTGLEWIGNRIRPGPALDRIMVTNGRAHSTLFLMSSLVGPGNLLLTEELTSPQVYSLAKIAAVEVQGVRIDDQGVIPDDFERKCKRHGPKAILLNCTIHTPTAYVTPTERRLAILSVARKYGVQIIEDDAQALYLDEPPESFATMAPDMTWYMLGCSEYLNRGIDLAFVVVPSQCLLTDSLERLGPISIWHPTPLAASVISRWIRTGVAQDLLQLARVEIRKRQAIVSELLSSIDGFRGSSGVHFWLPAPAGIRGEQFSRAIATAGILVQPSKVYAGHCEPRLEGIRPGIGSLLDLNETRYAMEIIRDIYYTFWFGSVP
ncbi:aminotransferase class I/II-fold pyridoxal phosphate-dependent enzyme [Bradyrhizobium sp. 30]|uniref:aminotransferase class I/II-fold pyridoxal phosphate-dependent enzyme n=1 Tax=Bradyrhizobium sp. 30 TaxID=2782669 RepID=UPI001FFB9924|nr:aminotransferase class I/II-fold pyridoxal phosphate-dependent enzyme [Bradyrhizobium sp. 30]MCK1292473.1 aminotransferase class I/II-fold pyridoxal phosphate-dependent enzyme [Bradyrhizobium sp. 30]